MTYHSQKLVEAKQAWSDEIIETFGPDDIDAVFEPRGEGSPGTKLHETYRAYIAALLAWGSSLGMKNRG